MSLKMRRIDHFTQCFNRRKLHFFYSISKKVILQKFRLLEKRGRLRDCSYETKKNSLFWLRIISQSLKNFILKWRTYFMDKKKKDVVFILPKQRLLEYLVTDIFFWQLKRTELYLFRVISESWRMKKVVVTSSRKITIFPQ